MPFRRASAENVHRPSGRWLVCYVTDRHITTSTASTRKKPARDDDWFKRKVAELGEALARLPEDRRCLVAEELAAREEGLATREPDAGERENKKPRP